MSQPNPADLTHALEHVGVPAYVVDLRSRFRWLNQAARAVFGDLTGRRLAEAVAPEDVHAARAIFARTLIGDDHAPSVLRVLAADGQRIAVKVTSVPFWEDGEIAGVFGLACLAGVRKPDAECAPSAAPALTPRQLEVLVSLADGLGTAEIAARLGVAEETARNHLRGLFRELGVHSRLEAVVQAYRLGLLEPARAD
jgi:PAS domain S-box-containing protein